MHPTLYTLQFLSTTNPIPVNPTKLSNPMPLNPEPQSLHPKYLETLYLKNRKSCWDGKSYTGPRENGSRSQGLIELKGLCPERFSGFAGFVGFRFLLAEGWAGLGWAGLGWAGLGMQIKSFR